MSAYYNEIDPHAAQWLRNLIAAGCIADGVVDERSIEDVRPNEIREFTQCHFFAGVGIWSKALRDAGWDDDRPIWTGSCPCQPFSTAGKGEGFADDRHLWPAWHHLIRECGPDEVFGEQVAGSDGETWLDLVASDMEAEGHAFGAVNTCAAGFGAPHIRNRHYFASYDLRSATSGLADADDIRRIGRGGGSVGTGPEETECAEGFCSVDRMADSDGHRREEGGEVRPVRTEHDPEHGGAVSFMADNTTIGRNSGTGSRDQGQTGQRGREPSNGGETDRMGDTNGSGLEGHGRPVEIGSEQRREVEERRCSEAGRNGHNRPASPTNGFWGTADWFYCRDGKWRPVEPGTFPLVNGATGRVGRLRAYGNGLCLAQATEFIRAYMERDLVDLGNTVPANFFDIGL